MIDIANVAVNIHSAIFQPGDRQNHSMTSAQRVLIGIEMIHDRRMPRVEIGQLAGFIEVRQQRFAYGVLDAIRR